MVATNDHTGAWSQTSRKLKSQQHMSSIPSEIVARTKKRASRGSILQQHDLQYGDRCERTLSGFNDSVVVRLDSVFPESDTLRLIACKIVWFDMFI